MTESGWLDLNKIRPSSPERIISIYGVLGVKQQDPENVRRFWELWDYLYG